MVLVDRFGRPLTHLRISVTSRCNHRCIFCHREGVVEELLRELSPEDLGFVARVASRLDITNYKLTGGEPLVRDDIVGIVQEIRPYASSISMTTNGSLLKKYARALVEAGLDYANVSLHSLKPSVFHEITGGKLEPVLEGISEALDSGLELKLDFLLLKHNRDEVESILDFASSMGVSINLIELIPLGMGREEWSRLHESLDPVVKMLEEKAVKKTVKEFQNRPTYILPSGIAVTVIRGYGNPDMCRACTRIRLTPDGRLKTCIFRNDNLVDAWDAIKSRDEEKLAELIREANKRREPFFKTRV